MKSFSGRFVPHYSSVGATMNSLHRTLTMHSSITPKRNQGTQRTKSYLLPA